MNKDWGQFLEVQLYDNMLISFPNFCWTIMAEEWVCVSFVKILVCIIDDYFNQNEGQIGEILFKRENGIVTSNKSAMIKSVDWFLLFFGL